MYRPTATDLRTRIDFLERRLDHWQGDYRTRVAWNKHAAEHAEMLEDLGFFRAGKRWPAYVAADPRFTVRIRRLREKLDAIEKGGTGCSLDYVIEMVAHLEREVAAIEI